MSCEGEIRLLHCESSPEAGEESYRVLGEFGCGNTASR